MFDSLLGLVLAKIGAGVTREEIIALVEESKTKRFDVRRSGLRNVWTLQCCGGLSVRHPPQNFCIMASIPASGEYPAKWFEGDDAAGHSFFDDAGAGAGIVVLEE